MTKHRVKKIFLAKNFRLYQKVTKNREKNQNIIVGSELSGTNNEPTFRLHKKIEKKV